MEATVDPQSRGPDWMPITPKTGSLFHADSQLGPAARIMHRTRATNERLARRATKIDAGSTSQSLLRHGDAAPSRHRGDGCGQAGRPAAENHNVVLTSFSVCPTGRV